MSVFLTLGTKFNEPCFECCGRGWVCEDWGRVPVWKCTRCRGTGKEWVAQEVNANEAAFGSWSW